MRLREVRDLLECEVVWGDDLLDEEVSEAFAADLMSDVLSFCRSDALLITGLTSIQSVHTSHVADLKAIVFVHHKQPGSEVLALARTRGIPLLTTPCAMFEACGRLYGAGLEGRR